MIKIIVSNEEEKHCMEMLLQNLQYAWDLRGEHTDSYYKALSMSTIALNVGRMVS
jgi:hypothetical protein